MVDEVQQQDRPLKVQLYIFNGAMDELSACLRENGEEADEMLLIVCLSSVGSQVSCQYSTRCVYDGDTKLMCRLTRERAKVGKSTRKRTRRRQLCCEKCEALTLEVEAGHRPKQTPVSSVSRGVLLHPAHSVQLQLSTNEDILALSM